jgi:5-methylcytosine-specific restriction endonuclease McrA
MSPMSPESRRVRAERERSTAGWSWETNSRRRSELVAQVLALKGTTCHLCRQPGATTADHRIPRHHGGLNVLDNLEPAHRSCNTARGTMSLEQWFAAHPVPRREALPPSRQW